VTHTWWYLARSSGMVAWVVLAMSVLWGLLLATRVFGRSPGPRWLTDLHRFLGGTAVAFTAIHVGAVVADSYVHFGAADVLVPFASAWRPVAVAWGVISLWMLAAVEISSLFMRHLSRRVWHSIHLVSYLLFFSSTLHALTAGTDTRNQFFMLTADALIATILLLTFVRVANPRERQRQPAASPSSS
jgi:DMSO/TMAO reductase YedYZ heme-binding membrane subunit